MAIPRDEKKLVLRQPVRCDTRKVIPQAPTIFLAWRLDDEVFSALRLIWNCFADE